jgi:hypothetical protein
MHEITGLLHQSHGRFPTSRGVGDPNLDGLNEPYRRFFAAVNGTDDKNLRKALEKAS